MKFPGGMDLNSMMQQAQQMQEKMAREMKETVVEASAGGGAVTVKMRGDFQVVELKISPDTVKEGDVDMIQDLTVAALGEADFRRATEAALSTLQSDADLRGYLETISRQEAREIIYGTVMEAAMADTVMPNEAPFLEWLAKTWNIQVRPVDPGPQ